MKKINKKNLIVVLIILLVVIIGIIILINIINNKSSNQEKELENLFKTMSVEYYKDFYYDKIGNTKEEREAFLKKYKTTGIQVNLDSLSRYNSEINTERIKKFVNEETNEKCDLKNSISILYPKEPYKKDSYEIEIKLDCGFKEEK